MVLVADLLTLPFAAWRQSVLTRYGLSTQGWGGWTVDLLKSYALSAVVAAVVLLGFYTVTRLAPRWWWAFGGGRRGGAGGAAVASCCRCWSSRCSTGSPRWRQGPLRTELIALAARDGVPVRDVLVADASRRTTAVNAYVSGLGPTRRIVVYDTLLREATAGRGDQSSSRTSWATPRTGDVLDRHADRRARRGRRGGRALPARLLDAAAAPGRRRLDRPSRARSRCWSPWSRSPGWSPRPVQALVSRRIEARADAHALGAHRRPGHLRGDAAAARRRSTWPTPTRPGWAVPLFGVAPVHGGADGRRPRVRPGGRPVSRTLLITNDFPPRPGGIQSFVHNLAVRQPPGSVVVYASTLAGRRGVRRRAAVPGGPRADPDAAAHPAGRPPGRRAAPASTAATRVWFGAAAPLGPARRRAAPTRRHPAGGGAHPRPRGRLGGAARRPRRCCGGSAGAPT